MKRVIFDTNVYGKLITEPDFSYLKNCIISDKNLAVYGYLLIRKELRDIPKQPLRSKQTRILLLGLYDEQVPHPSDRSRHCHYHPLL